MKAKISNISEISSYLIEKEQTCSILPRLYKVLKLGAHLKSVSQSKSQGMPICELMYGLLIMQVCGLSIYADSKQYYWHLLSCRGKDTFYHFLNRATTNWHKLLYDVTDTFISICALRGSGNQHKGPCCLIFDDTLLPKTGKKQEGITKVYDHVCGKMCLRYKLLGMVYFDGISSLSADFSIYHEPGKKKDGGEVSSTEKSRIDKARCPKSPGSIRKKELELSKMESIKMMLSRALKNKFKVDYVLMDSRFPCYDLLNQVLNLWEGKSHVIGRCKMDNTQYEINGKKSTAMELRLLHIGKCYQPLQLPIRQTGCSDWMKH